MSDSFLIEMLKCNCHKYVFGGRHENFGHQAGGQRLGRGLRKRPVA